MSISIKQTNADAVVKKNHKSGSKTWYKKQREWTNPSVEYLRLMVAISRMEVARSSKITGVRMQILLQALSATEKWI